MGWVRETRKFTENQENFGNPVSTVEDNVEIRPRGRRFDR